MIQCTCTCTSTMPLHCTLNPSFVEISLSIGTKVRWVAICHIVWYNFPRLKACAVYRIAPKYWRELNLLIGSKINIGEILVDFTLAVFEWDCHTYTLYASKKFQFGGCEVRPPNHQNFWLYDTYLISKQECFHKHIQELTLYLKPLWCVSRHTRISAQQICCLCCQAR